MMLSDYLAAERGRTPRVAKAIGFAPAYLWQIANGKRPLPADRAADLERCCAGEVRRWDMFPQTWHRIWPELVGTEGAPPVPAEHQEAA